MDDRAMQVDGVSLIPGTPTKRLEESALVVKLWRTIKESKNVMGGTSKRSHSMTSVYVVRPNRAGYIIKPLTPAAEVRPETILSCVVSTAHFAGVSKVYVNADLERLPFSPCAANEDPGCKGTPMTEESHVRLSL